MSGTLETGCPFYLQKFTHNQTLVKGPTTTHAENGARFQRDGVGPMIFKEDHL
jgi:hypothetical protein